MAVLVPVSDNSPSSFLSRGAIFVCGVGLGLGIGILLTRRIVKFLVRDEIDSAALKCFTDELKALRKALERVESRLETFETQNNTRNQSVKDYVSVRPSSDDEEEDEFFEPDETDFIDSRVINEKDTEVDLDLIDKLWNGKVESDMLKAHEILERRIQDSPKNVELSWRLGRSYFELASIRGKMGDTEGKKRCLQQGINIGKQAVEMDDTCSEAHKWYACLIGSYTDFDSTQDQILNGYKYKKHVERCLELKPTDATAYHLLGRWCYEVSLLSWWQRKAASALIAEPPTSTVEEALDNFLKAEDLNPDSWKSNMLWIGKCYWQQGSKENARNWMEKSFALSPQNDDDEEAHKEAENLLSSL